MKDYTIGVNELRDHYNQLRLFKKSIRTQVKMEYEAKIDFEIKSRTESAELKFANHLASVKERDSIPVRILQDEVLRTRTWSVWEKIRDLAGIPGEFIRAEDARETKRRANAVFLWAEDYSTLTVQKDANGNAIQHLVYDMATNSKFGTIWWPDATDREADMNARHGDEGQAFARMVSDEIQRAIDAGHVEG